MNTSNIIHVFPFLFAFAGTVNAQQATPEAQEPFLHRFGLGAGGSYTVMHLANIGSSPPDELELQVPGWCALISYTPDPRHTIRVMYTHSGTQERDRVDEITQPFWDWSTNESHEVVASAAVQERWWFNDVRVDLLYRPARWERRSAGPYLVTGLSIRNVFLEETAAADYEAIMYRPTFGPDIWNGFLVIHLAAGYEAHLGPLRAFAELGSMISSQPAILGGVDEGLSFRWGATAGLRYVFGE